MTDDGVDALVSAILAAQRQGRPLVMGIVNVTPDSFSDGGRFDNTDAAVAYALDLVQAGADLLDIGGESTRPGAEPVTLAEELARVVPVIETLSDRTPIPISIDTSKPEVMRRAVAAGARMINDVNALRAPEALSAAAELQVPVCLMHMQGQPRTMQTDPVYDDVVAEVGRFLRERVAACLEAGLRPDRLVLDPGYGFGKTLAHNLTLLQRQAELLDLGFPLLVGLSRKSMLGALTGRSAPDQRLAASVTAAVLSAQRGAAIVRVHDVAATVDALKILHAASR